MKILPSFLLISLLGLQGCTALMVGAGVGAASVAHDRRTLGAQVDDKTASSRVSTALSRNEALKEQANINPHMYNGVLLLVGQAPTENLRQQALQVVESVKHIGKIHDQIRIQAPISASTVTHDLWLSSKIKTSLLTDERVGGLHITVIVENAEVFLMGIVGQQEADIAVEIARNISGVAQVIKAFEYL